MASDEQLRRDVALKLIQPLSALDEMARDRFELEAEITGKLEPPGVVPIYGDGTRS